MIENVLRALDFKEEKFSFKREDYAMKNSFVRLIEENFQRKAEKDCFASQTNSICGEFFTKFEDALQKDWGEGGTVWLNPPWSLWPMVLRKLRNISCDAICIVPDWRRGWVRELLRKASKRMYFQPGTRIFEVD